MRRVREVRALPLEARDEWPLVSFVIPACDEEHAIESALRSVLDQSYPRLQVVAVDDRSTDGTGEVIDRLAAADPRLTAVHVKTLPEGWLGKLNALHEGTARARGEWLLFADADAHLGKDTLKKIIGHADRAGLDFLSVIPHIASAGIFGDAAFHVVLAMFSLGARPWRIPDPRAKEIGASGAFLLVRRAAFEKTPGFEWLKLEVADDFGLCLLVKSHGGRCELLNGKDEVKIVWYASLREFAQKMQKNFFAITGRVSLARIAAQAGLVAWMGLFPLAALVPTRIPHAPAIVGLSVAAQIAMSALGAAWTGRSFVPCLFGPFGYLAIAVMAIRSGVVGKRIGGIRWRRRLPDGAPRAAPARARVSVTAAAPRRSAPASP
jgi:hypothetical protein